MEKEMEKIMKRQIAESEAETAQMYLEDAKDALHKVLNDRKLKTVDFLVIRGVFD